MDINYKNILKRNKYLEGLSSQDQIGKITLNDVNLSCIDSDANKMITYTNNYKDPYLGGFRNKRPFSVINSKRNSTFVAKQSTFEFSKEDN
jgi:hypothetical protein